MRSFDDVVKVLKTTFELRYDKELMDMLNISLGRWKKLKSDGRIPFLDIIIACEENNINSHELFIGKGFVEIKAKRSREQKEIERLKLAIEASQKSGKSALRKAKFDMEFLVNQLKDKSTNKQDKPIKQEFLTRGTINHMGSKD